MVSYISVLFYEERQKCAGRYCVFSSLVPSLPLFLNVGNEKKRKKTTSATHWQRTFVYADVMLVEGEGEIIFICLLRLFHRKVNVKEKEGGRAAEESPGRKCKNMIHDE